MDLSSHRRRLGDRVNLHQSHSPPPIGNLQLLVVIDVFWGDRVNVSEKYDYSKLRGCDLVGLKVRAVCHGDQVAARAIVVQHKTQRPVQFEITPAARDAVQAWIKLAGLKPEDFCFPAGFPTRSISAPVSTPGSSGTGLTNWGWTPPTTAHTRCEG